MNKYITYEGYKHDKYIGKRLYDAVECARDDQYKVKESMLVRDKDGILGDIGYGIHGGMNYLTKSGGYAFNPIKESDLLWCVAHNCYIFREQKSHFLFPIKLDEFYILKKSRKYLGFFDDIEIPKLPKEYCIFRTKSEYF